MENRISFYLHKATIIITVMMGAASLCTCTEEDMHPSVVRFYQEAQSIQEGSESQITLTLDKPANRSCSVRIKLETNAVYGDHFTVTPEIEKDGTLIVNIEKGQKSVWFNIASLNNNLFDNGKFILLTLMDPTDGLALSSSTTSTITIDDDEGPSLATFDMVNWVIPETESVVIEIPFSAPTKGEGSITIHLEPRHAVYGERFTTIPASVNNTITLPILPNATGTSISFSPLDDNIFIGDFEIIFSITAVSGVLQKGELAELSLRVMDNELPSVATFVSETETVAEEDADGIDVEIALSAPAAGTGTVYVTFISPDDGGAIYGKDFESIPPAVGNTIPLPVAFHDENVRFKVFPLQNSTCINLLATMRITGASGCIVIDETTASTITIKDDDRSLVTFEEADATIGESESAGIKVHLNFSEPALDDVTLLLIGQTSDGLGNPYGTLYVTNPAMVPDFYDLYLPLSVQKGQTTSDFTIMPMNNDNDNSDSSLVFSLAFSSNNCFIPGGVYNLTIKDDD